MTELPDWNDTKSGVNAVAVITRPFGTVRRGFNNQVHDLLPRLENPLKADQRTLWLTGH